MKRPTPLGRDKAAQNLAELISLLEASGEFGKPVNQSGSNGPETLFRCPLCAGAGKDSKGRMLRVARRLDGTDVPYVGCRTHDSPETWRELRRALTDAGVPGRLLKPASGHESAAGRPLGKPGRPTSPGSGRRGFPERPDGLGETEPVDDEQVSEWCERLWSPDGQKWLRYLERRGLSTETIEQQQLGLGAFVWTAGKQPKPCITIPIFDANGDCVNVRLATVGKGAKRMPLPHPEYRKLDEDGAETSKYQTYGQPARFYGVDELATDLELGKDAPVFIVAGEWDRLLGWQAGLLTLSSTGGEGTLPRKADAEYLQGRDVVVIYDCDDAGRRGAAKMGNACLGIGARSVRVVDLDSARDDGYDLGDYLAEGGEVDGLLQRVAATPEFEGDGNDAGGEPPVWEQSDLGMAEQVMFRAAGGLRYVEDLSAWMSWDKDGGLWKTYAKGDWIAPTQAVFAYAREMQRELADAEEESAEEGWRKHTRKYLNAANNGSAVRMMSSIWETRTSIADIDARPDLLNLDNGTYHLRTGELRDARPEDLLTKRTFGGLLESAHKGEWDRFLRRFVPDGATRRWLRYAVGYSLLDGNPRRLLVILKGPGGTGKTTFAEILQRVFGPYAGPINLSLFRDSQDERPRADLIAAMTRRIVFASETSAAWKLHVDQLKRLTGNETIAARLPHSPKLFERRPAFTPWVLTNDTPTVDGVDAPFFRRLVVVPFHTVIAEEEEGADYVEDVIRDVADEVMTWALDGLRAYREAGNRLPPKSKPMMLEEMEVREQFNSLTAFLAEYTTQGPDCKVSTTDLFLAYETYCMNSGVHERDRFNQIELGRRLRKLGPYEPGKSGSNRFWRGLQLNTQQN